MVIETLPKTLSQNRARLRAAAHGTFAARSASGGRPLTTGFGASGAPELPRRFVLTDPRPEAAGPQGPRKAWIPLESNAAERPEVVSCARGSREVPLCAGVRQQRGCPEGTRAGRHEGVSHKACPEGTKEQSVVRRSATTKRPPQRQRRLDVARTPPVKACPEGELREAEEKEFSRTSV